MNALPGWCEPLLDAARMRAVDGWAIEQRGVPSLELMERAGEGVAHAVEELVPDGPVAVLCGKGNNGGDGLVLARLLRHTGRAVQVVFVCEPGELSRDARANFERLEEQRVVLVGEPEAREAVERSAVIVDALLGTGFAGEPHGAVAEAIELANASAVPIVSVDVPSGVDASTGEVGERAIQAQLTVTFHVAKPGLWIHPGKDHAGDTRVIDIGVPRGAPGAAEVGLIGPSIRETLPRRGSRSTKFSSGHAVVVGGSRGLMGAPAMSALACMRAGAGYVTACVPDSQTQILDVQLMEVMTRGLPDEQGALTPAAIAPALATLEPAGALALGPGVGRKTYTASFVRELARNSRVAMVLDADGLNAHAGRLRELAAREAPTVLTPHAGELGRLLELDSKQIESHRLKHVRAAAKHAGAVVVLKGDDTLIADPCGLVAVSRGGSPALATAGTGDVLTGVILALLAQGLDAFTAAAGGVYVHAEAGREAARRQGGADGVIASDVIAALPVARAGVSRDRGEGRAHHDGSQGAASHKDTSDGQSA